MNAEQLAWIMECPIARAEKWLAPLQSAMHEFDIDSVPRQTMFLAQVGHESGRLRYVRELGSASYLDKYDTGRLAKRLGNTPDDDDDGIKYCGRGLLQVTGAYAYRLCGEGLGLPLLQHPELLEAPDHAARSAGWVWRDFKKLNPLADLGDFERITRRINGGLNGYEDRKHVLERAQQVLK